MHLVGFIIKKFVTMHGHMNVKYTYINSIILNEPFEMEPGNSVPLINVPPLEMKQNVYVLKIFLKEKFLPLIK